MASIYTKKKEKLYHKVRKWGFSGKEDAGKAKRQLGLGLVEVIRGVLLSEREISNSSDRIESFVYSGDYGWVEERESGGVEQHLKGNGVFDENAGTIFYNDNYISIRHSFSYRFGIFTCIAIGAKSCIWPKEGRANSKLRVSIEPWDIVSQLGMDTLVVQKILAYLETYQYSPSTPGLDTAG